MLSRLRLPWTVLALVLVSFCVPSRAQSKEEIAVPAMQVQVASDGPPTPADFDGDRIVDPLFVERTSWPRSVEIHLSRTREVSFLPMDSARTVTGSLTVRDLDHDGDTDLFWKGAFSLAPPTAIIWLNDGTGRFARLLALNSRRTGLAPVHSLRKDAGRGRLHYGELPAPRAAAPANLLMSDWSWHLSTSGQRTQGTVLPVISFLTRPPSDRGPPTLF